ncbi:putative inhibitor of apoptosis [Schistocerca serialis cubense]|uniref:putative inhibitor of apoptosis n=1 Tax=Schistocerca serialis cubense TaxID=2023355 RepID=UPI00214E4D5F|nr:putative inhibitor of apoptosis [Schistocerca serialis cubense]
MLLQPTPSTAAAGDGGAAPHRQPPRPADVPDYAAPSLATTEGRLRTFRHGDWPVSFLAAEEVAAAGFYFLRRGDDAVKCFYCDVVVNKWEPSDDPLAEHRRWSPRCPFLNPSRRGCADAVSYDSCSPFGPPAALQSRPQPKPTPVHAKRPAFPQYCGREARLASFKDWPPAIPVKPAALSEAGFFYSGSGDRTICYYCGRGLRDWDANDDPWVEHELWFPGCWHVSLHRGNDFVNEIARNRDDLIAAKTDPHQTATVVRAESSKSQPRQETPDSRVEKTENGATEEKRLCKICFEKEMGVVFLPCGHIVACVDCALSVADCPVCRQPFQNTARVYLS